MNEQLRLDLQPVPEVYRIPLTKGQFATVDPEDYCHLIRFKWQARWCRYTKSFYADRTEYIVGKSTRQLAGFGKVRLAGGESLPDRIVQGMHSL